MIAELTASQQRSQAPLLVAAFSLPSLLPKLPLSFPLLPDVPPSPKRRYRCQYTYLGYDQLLLPAAWTPMSLFDLALHLVDFRSLEPVIASMVYRPSARGHVPFHPVSMFLLLSWRVFNRWSRTQTLTNLADSRYDDYRQRFGFSKGNYPTEGGLRHFETSLGTTSGNDLIAQTVELAHFLGIISQQAQEWGILAGDGMLHAAASRMRCSSVDDACYKPAPRKCRAKEEKGRQGCDCTELACAQVCKHATPRDPEARFIVYKRRNQADGPNAPMVASADDKSPRGEPLFGYRTVDTQLIDRVRRNSFVLAHGLLAANTPEDKLATELMKESVERYDWVDFRVAVYDAGAGREPFLSTAYGLGLRRGIDLRADDEDAKVGNWPIRGYDDQGTPVCPFGYRLHPNGWDEQRRRFKWCCKRTCESPSAALAARNGGERKPQGPSPPDCAHRFDGDKHGLVVNVGRSFADGSTRLVRDFPHNSPFAKKLYARARNAAERRNAEFEEAGLKRMPVFGWERVQAMANVVDPWINVKTIVRVIREAVLAGSGLSPP